MSNSYRRETFFQFSVQKSRKYYISIKHSEVEQSLLQAASNRNLIKKGRLGYQLKNMSNKKVCMTTEHNNYLRISKEVALRYQPAANLLKDAISDSVPTSCNNQHLLRLSYLVGMIEDVRIGKSIR